MSLLNFPNTFYCWLPVYWRQGWICIKASREEDREDIDLLHHRAVDQQSDKKAIRGEDWLHGEHLWLVPELFRLPQGGSKETLLRGARKDSDSGILFSGILYILT